MQLRDFFSRDAVSLELSATAKPAAIEEMIGLLGVDPEIATTLRKLLDRREELGSTGVGRGIAIPHCRASVIPQLRLAYGRVSAEGGISYDAIDKQPVHHLFLIVAPPVEVSNLYLPVLGRLAQFAKGDDIPDRLAALTSPDQFFALLDERAA
jgi:mannitol/fructose-specific phosphotransferase system IIA component (Ntr-type)